MYIVKMHPLNICLFTKCNTDTKTCRVDKVFTVCHVVRKVTSEKRKGNLRLVPIPYMHILT